MISQGDEQRMEREQKKSGNGKKEWETGGKPRRNRSKIKLGGKEERQIKEK